MRTGLPNKVTIKNKELYVLVMNTIKNAMRVMYVTDVCMDAG